MLRRLRSYVCTECFILKNGPDSLSCFCIWLLASSSCSVQIDANCTRRPSRIEQLRVERHFWDTPETGLGLKHWLEQLRLAPAATAHTERDRTRVCQMLEFKMNTHNIVAVRGFVEWSDYSDCRDGVCGQLGAHFRHVEAALEKHKSLITTQKTYWNNSCVVPFNAILVHLNTPELWDSIAVKPVIILHLKNFE